MDTLCGGRRGVESVGVLRGPVGRQTQTLSVYLCEPFRVHGSGTMLDASLGKKPSRQGLLRYKERIGDPAWVSPQLILKEVFSITTKPTDPTCPQPTPLTTGE